jgi:uncharacterized protein YjdB
MRKKFFYGLTVILMVTALLIGGCEQPINEEEPGGPEGNVTSVSITGSEGAVNGIKLDIYVGGTINLNATVLPADAPNKGVDWSVSPAGIVTVDNGTITGAAEGLARVTVTTKAKKADGNPATNWVDINVQLRPEDIPLVLALHNQANPPVEGTTTVLPVFTTEGSRLIINNVTSTTGWGTNYNQVTGNTIVYLARPLAAPYSISARIKISEAHRDPQTDNGVIMGVFTDPKVDTSLATASGENAILFAGIANATTGRKRMYTSRSSDNTNSSASAGEFNATNVAKEYVFTVVRGGAAEENSFEMTVVDDSVDPSETKLQGTRTTADAQSHSRLRSLDNTPVYLGFIISGVKAEISSIVISQGEDLEPVYESPAATPTPRPAITGVTITNTETTVNVGSFLQMTAEVAPEGADDRLTWSIDPADDSVATIDPATGLVTGVGAGDVTVFATSVDNGAIKSAGTIVTVEDVPEVIENNRSWNFQTRPQGWPTSGNTSSGTPDYYYGQGMTLLSSIRTMQVNPAGSAPSGSGFSNGFLQAGGAAVNGYARIDEVQGPFDITIKYSSNTGDSAGRYPSIKLGDAEAVHGAGSTQEQDPQTHTASYSGTDKITVLILTETGMNPGRIYDVIIEYKGQ